MVNQLTGFRILRTLVINRLTNFSQGSKKESGTIFFQSIQNASNILGNPLRRNNPNTQRKSFGKELTA